MNIVFLDVDGVLNDENYIKKCNKKINKDWCFCFEQVPFNPRSLKNLQMIVDNTNAKIVLTSTWRLKQSHMFVLKARLSEYGLTIDDKTDFINWSARGQEISKYLSKCPQNTKYVVIDDEVCDIVTEIDKKNVVKINPKFGLTVLKASKCIDILNKGEY